jgi:hypothetical protein
MKFNYSWDNSDDPELNRFYGEDIPSITAKGNLTYLQFIDQIQHLWNKSNPEIDFMPYASNHIFNPEKGYIIYSLEMRKPQANNSKPRVHEVVDHPDDDTKKLVVYIQSFENLIRFTAVHKDPRTSEEIIEQFEDFMIWVTPIFIKSGIENFFYGRRISDNHDARLGDDLALRAINYLVITQKILTVDMAKLEEYTISIALNDGATPTIF